MSIRIHCDGPNCGADREPDSRRPLLPPVDVGPIGQLTDRRPRPLTPRRAAPPRWLSLKRGEELFDFCSPTCLSAWAGGQGKTASKTHRDALLDSGTSRSRE